jgi:hypothetical protein
VFYRHSRTITTAKTFIIVSRLSVTFLALRCLVWVQCLWVGIWHGLGVAMGAVLAGIARKCLGRTPTTAP